MKNYLTLTQEQRENTRRACFAEIVAEFPHAFQELHRLAGFDFVKPFEMFKHSGNWTINQASKIFNLSDGFCFALIRSPKKWRNDKYMVVDISDGSAQSVNPKYCSGLDNYFRKSDFEEDRKNPETVTYFIYQRAEHIAPQNIRGLDLSQRFTKCGTIHIGTTSSGVNYISDVKLTTPAGDAFNYRAFSHYYCSAEAERKPRQISEIVDKSGYIVYKRREELKTRAAALKAEREKAAAEALDKSEYIKAATELYYNYRSDIIESIAAAVTYAEICEADKKLSRLCRVALAFERFIKKCEENSFVKIESLYNAFNDLAEQMKYTAQAVA